MHMISLEKDGPQKKVPMQLLTNGEILQQILVDH